MIANFNTDINRIDFEARRVEWAELSHVALETYPQSNKKICVIEGFSKILGIVIRKQIVSISNTQLKEQPK